MFYFQTVTKCRSGRPHYQKVTGYEAVTSRFMSLRPPTPAAIQRSGVLIDCLDKCSADQLCAGINYNAPKQTCVGIESDDGMSDSSGPFVQLPTSRSNGSENFLLRPNAAVGYFESLCLQRQFCHSIVLVVFTSDSIVLLLLFRSSSWVRQCMEYRTDAGLFYARRRTRGPPRYI